MAKTFTAPETLISSDVVVEDPELSTLRVGESAFRLAAVDPQFRRWWLIGRIRRPVGLFQRRRADFRIRFGGQRQRRLCGCSSGDASGRR